MSPPEEPRPSEKEPKNQWFAFGDPVYETPRDTDPVSDETVPATVPAVTQPRAPVTGMLRSPRNNHEFGQLYYSEREVSSIRGIKNDTRVLTGQDATESFVAEHLDQNAALIHFSCHGYYDEEHPLQSALALTSENEQENGFLHAWEIMDRYSLDARLVVMASCESGLGKDFGPEGLLGLTRAFQYAGARSVVASLWRISDRATMTLMKTFYEHLHNGVPKDEALRLAQVGMIESGNPGLAHPLYWAGFQLHGDWSPLPR